MQKYDQLPMSVADACLVRMAELDLQKQRIEIMQAALQRISHCGCGDLDQCAHRIASKRC